MLKPHFLVLHMLMTNVFQPGRKNDHHSTYIALFGSRVAGTFSRPYSSVELYLTTLELSWVTGESTHLSNKLRFGMQYLLGISSKHRFHVIDTR